MSSKSKRGPNPQKQLVKGSQALAPKPTPPPPGTPLDPVPVPRAFLQALLSYLDSRPRAEVNRGATSLEILLNQVVKEPAKSEKPAKKTKAEPAEVPAEETAS